MQVDEIHDITEPEPVYEVSGRAAEYQREWQIETDFLLREIKYGERYGYQGNAYKSGRLIFEEAESGAGIFNEREADDLADRGD